MPPRRKDTLNETASDVFVNRETPKRVFEDAVFSIPQKGCIIRTWYGIGGQGKTALARELFRMSSNDVEASYSHLRRGMLDLHGKPKTDPVRLLLWIRNAFAKSGVSFPAFDLAFTIMWEATRGEEPLPNFTNPWLKRTSEFAGDASTDTIILSRELFEEFAETIPGLGFLIKRGARYAFERSKKSWLEKTRDHLKCLYRNGEIIPSYELSELMPWMLAQDMNQHLKENPNDRFVLFIDEYESVFDAGGMGERWQDNKFDEYMRSFIAETDGLLALFFSRERLQWENSKDWQDDLKDAQHILGGLSEKDADEWLLKVSVNEADIRKAMIEGAREEAKTDAPIYPLLLDLQVQHWQNLASEATASDFSVSAHTFEGRLKTLVIRLLRDYPDAIEQALHHLAIPTHFDEDVFQHVIKTNNIPVSFGTFDRLKEISIVTENDNGWLSIHRAIADAIVILTKEQNLKKYRQSLIDYFSQRANPTRVSDVDQDTLIAMSEAMRLKLQQGVDGYVGWFYNTVNKIKEAEKAVFLELSWQQVFMVLKNSLGEGHPDTLTTRHNLAQQIGNQGRYGEAEAEFRAIWEIQRQPDALGEEHPSTLTTRHNLAQQIGNQGRYGEAEAELRAIWEIQRQPDALGEEHPDTLATRHNLARQIGTQGRYGEAEAELRAIWEIQRQPDALGEEHPDNLRLKFYLAQVLDGQEQSDEATDLLTGLDEAMAQHFSNNHRWRTELAQYMSDR